MSNELKSLLARVADRDQGTADELRRHIESLQNADAIMDRIVHNTIWVDTGNHNMREHASMNP
ncbi:hypothetical protein [Nocardioides sp. AE5]|uniref:hypothetical protein n=1 Tax=Nocardioides sp. AE5 TaxID=2962573 RepID=UPI0028810AD0|nr:hypothetical protein [Nocardioides sp. AE5]MDT0203924.1 hypothetical protein [Nocardioides sp. AE5]